MSAIRCPNCRSRNIGIGTHAVVIDAPIVLRQLSTGFWRVERLNGQRNFHPNDLNFAETMWCEDCTFEFDDATPVQKEAAS